MQELGVAAHRVAAWRESMGRPGILVVSVSLIAAFVAFATAGGCADAFSPYVDEAGNIKVPISYRAKWDHLGTWSIASKGERGGAAEFHSVYTQPGTIDAYRKTGAFPDGAVLVKELLQTETGSLSTGKVSWETGIKGWFVMVKDAKGRFPDNKLWGDGWGWALFNADNPTVTVTADYKTDCIPCHLPVKGSDWVYTYGYPPLR
jgi:hypothetical protein